MFESYPVDENVLHRRIGDPARMAVKQQRRLRIRGEDVAVGVVSAKGHRRSGAHPVRRHRLVPFHSFRIA